MKLLHTSDLHLGNSLGGVDRDDEFLEFFEYLKDVIEKEKIDILLVSGDIFDYYYPSSSAVKLYYDFLMNIKRLVKKVIIIGGNHDSPKHLIAPKEILKFLDIIVVSGADNDFKEIIEFDDFVIVAIPFLRESILKKFSDNFVDAFRKIYQISTHKRAIAMGHFNVLNAKRSSERDIYIGKIEGVPVDVFEGYDYVALGHIHKHQELKKGVVYSGSPLKFSFSEGKKKLVIVDTNNFGYKVIDVPVFREFYSLKGSFEEIRDKIKTLKSHSFVEIELNEIVNSLYLDELKRDDLNLVKIKMPYKRVSRNLDIKKFDVMEFIDEIFKDDKDLDEIKKVIKELNEDN